MFAPDLRSRNGRWLAVVGLVMGLLATSCGGQEAAAPLPLAPGGRSLDGGAAEAAMDAAEPGIEPWAPVVFVAGSGLPTMGGERTVYRLRPGTQADLRAVADAIGVTGEIVTEGDLWRIEAADHVLESWNGIWFGYYAGRGIEVRVDEACAPDGDCEEPTPPARPADLPTAQEAEQLARGLFDAVGPSLDGAEVTVDDGITAWFVRIRYQVAGMLVDGFEAYASVGVDGILDAYGPLGDVEEVGNYPTITAIDAVERLNEGFGYWFATEAQPGADVAPDEPVTDRPTEVPYTEPEPVTVTLTDATRTLTAFHSWDGSGMYLLPAYRYVADDGSQPTVPAVTDDVIAPPPAPSEGSGDEPGGGDGSEVKPVSAPLPADDPEVTP